MERPRVAIGTRVKVRQGSGMAENANPEPGFSIYGKEGDVLEPYRSPHMGASPERQPSLPIWWVNVDSIGPRPIGEDWLDAV